jgi:CheY-like chemotaxis protein
MSDFDRLNSDLVLIVDDIPENLSVLHDALDESGYTVLVATNGETALQRARQSLPDVILLDAMMPGIDGFEVARRLKADFTTRHIPIVFMTGLTETEHVVAAFEAGGADYVTKPIRPAGGAGPHCCPYAECPSDEAGSHRPGCVRPGHPGDPSGERKGRVADPFGPQADAGLFFRPRGRGAGKRSWPGSHESTRARRQGRDFPPLHINQGARRLIFNLHERAGDDECLLVLREESDAAVVEALTAAFRLTAREAEVLYWVIKGKTSPDIGEILGSSPRTVNKHLEHVFTKLGVENRTAAASVAMARIRMGGACRTA